MVGNRRARWQLLVVVGGRGADGRGWWGRIGWQITRWGQGSVGQESQMAGDGGDGRVQEGQMGAARSQIEGGKWAVRGHTGAARPRWQ